MRQMPPEPEIELLTTSGTFSLDGGTWEVENNVWIIANDRDAVVIDPAHDARAVATALGDRELRAIICTHAHDDHIGAAPELAALTGAPILLHPDDLPLWKQTHPSDHPDEDLRDGQRITVGGIYLHVRHTPGHSPGGVSIYVPALDAVFTGDTLFKDGPGATRRSFSDFPTIVASIQERLLTLPPETTVHPGHGATTTIGEEASHVDDWIARGH
ncbi:MBL fold metallo-hydrolase [Kitasatospora sp. MAP5-34]|uniref:MBL fold metallo-hydrolase n=1 Tax=Kitasatospora sp. MAP5-34 TaxID=3035102 RepID=UPI00247429B5|nr:MBL fold metallo-hydrolase [Kitasatospora sp. MAP5-34]MDH6579370.1 glyoxylase-like metal-dependent hydrolase (beta-lactamase superfamily II) [Kitasatospora sp. MAP5-34]